MVSGVLPGSIGGLQKNLQLSIDKRGAEELACCRVIV
jgi:hypothetical protein